VITNLQKLAGLTGTSVSLPFPDFFIHSPLTSA
jgi:hypothetical protein